VEDGATPRDGEVAERFRQLHKFQRFYHPAYSPDLNAIENLWAVPKARVEARRPVAKTKAELIVHFETERALIPMDW